jgi:hypothetical protein
VAAVTFQILSLWRFALHEMMVPLMGSVQHFFWNILQQLHIAQDVRMSENLSLGHLFNF